MVFAFYRFLGFLRWFSVLHLKDTVVLYWKLSAKGESIEWPYSAFLNTKLYRKLNLTSKYCGFRNHHQWGAEPTGLYYKDQKQHERPLEFLTHKQIHVFTWCVESKTWQTPWHAHISSPAGYLDYKCATRLLVIMEREWEWKTRPDALCMRVIRISCISVQQAETRAAAGG